MLSDVYFLFFADNVIHRARQSFNKPQGLTSRINLSEVEMELRLRPPYLLSLSDIEPVRNGYKPQPSAHIGGKYRRK